jgi:hypothetical protein
MKGRYLVIRDFAYEDYQSSIEDDAQDFDTLEEALDLLPKTFPVNNDIVRVQVWSNDALVAESELDFMMPYRHHVACTAWHLTKDGVTRTEIIKGPPRPGAKVLPMTEQEAMDEVARQKAEHYLIEAQKRLEAAQRDVERWTTELSRYSTYPTREE